MTSTKTYLTDIMQSIKRIEDYTKGGRTIFDMDTKTQDAVARNFEIIGEVVKRLPPEMLTQYPDVPWRAVAGFRDVLIHDYATVDLDEVWLTIERDLPPLKTAIQTMLDKINSEDDEGQ